MLRYSTKHRTVKFVDTSRWRPTEAWTLSKVCTKSDVEVSKEVTLGKKHDDCKIIRRSRIR